MDDLCPVVRVEKRFAKDIFAALRKESMDAKEFRVSPVTGTDKELYVPINPSKQEDVKRVLVEILAENFENDKEYLQFCPKNQLVKAKSQPRSSGIEQIRSILRSQFDWPEENLLEIPDKWIRYGDVIVLETTNVPKGPSAHVLEAFHQSGVSPDLRCIMIHSGPIGGELRQPKITSYTPEASSETLHIENGIKFKFDVQQIMFAPGNGTERIRFANMKLTSKNELAIDMFTGLGYFTLPFAKFHKENVTKLIAIEKNPVSFGYLTQNVKLNKLENIVFPVCGDNRVVAEEYVGKADRILMGYLPNTKDFIPRALQFANPNKSVIFHYHHNCQKSEFKTLAVDDFVSLLAQLHIKRAVKLLEFSKVKSYAPKLFHCCADIELGPVLE